MTVLTAPKSSLVDDGIAKPGDSPISGTAESFEGCPGVIWSTSHIFVSTHFLPFHISDFLQVEHPCLLVFGLLLYSLYLLSSYTGAIVLFYPALQRCRRQDPERPTRHLVPPRRLSLPWTFKAMTFLLHRLLRVLMEVDGTTLPLSWSSLRGMTSTMRAVCRSTK